MRMANQKQNCAEVIVLGAGVHDKNKLARIFKIFVPSFSRDCENFHSTKFVIPFWNDQ